MHLWLAYLAWTSLFAVSIAAKATASICTCGFFDPIAQTVFTDSLIVYFNETESLPVPGFVEEVYQHSFEKGWNTQFRRGASNSNVIIDASAIDTNGSQSLELHVSPAQQDHLVVGGSLRTLRRDIQYGSFTSLLRSPGPWAGDGGSALSMALQYNVTQMVTINLQNKDLPDQASISMRESDEFPAADIAIPYHDVNNGSFGDGRLSSPWDFMDFQITWTKTEVKYYIGGYLARIVSKDDKPDLFSVPSPLFLRHWSSGSNYSSQGPPKQPSIANVGWVRAFFNSSVMTEDDHEGFDTRCQEADACRSDDFTLRGSTPYPQSAALEWEQKPILKPTRWIPIWIAIASISLTTILLLGPAWKRVQEGAAKLKKREVQVRKKPKMLETNWTLHDAEIETLPGSATSTLETQMGALSTSPKTLDGSLASPTTELSFRSQGEPVDSIRTHATRTSLETTILSDRWSLKPACGDFERDSACKSISARPPSMVTWSETVIPAATMFSEISYGQEQQFPRRGECDSGNDRSSHLMDDFRLRQRSELEVPTGFVLRNPKRKSVAFIQSDPGKQHNEEARQIFRKSTPDAPTGQRLSTARKKSVASYNVQDLTTPCEGEKFISHLAGLASLSCLLITAINLSLTFVNGSITPGAFTHYSGEAIIRKTIGTFLLNFVWVGPFILTSTRFLVWNYLRTGDLLPLAEKTVRRVPRLILPVTAIVLLEYFLIDCGATKWLEYLPSVSWSMWPFVREFRSFGSFLNELLELMYLIPNAAPTITLNFCTGVLWMIPIQLQGSWLTLLAVVIIYEIKTPWKRITFYVFCITSHWYAVSWGSYFYAGILVSDLDYTYKWRSFLYDRPFAYFPLLLLCILLALGSLSMDFVTQWTNVNYVTSEYAIHPDVKSGLSISEAGTAIYPDYFVPRLNGLLFAAGLQAAVGLSPLIQKVFSVKVLVRIYPHILSIYLIHGFVFWSLGSWLCIRFAVHGLPYWVNVLIVATSCYAVIAISLPLLTPMLDSLGKTIAREIWDFASEEPVPRRPTLHPFPLDFLKREEISSEVSCA